ncbi:hypothetical protein LF887_05270 [Chryseobacterium sp. MEBOG06]|uniref:hypothetical protein n=1 Tax=unclassified Chryseobacterium TaxID=2593645 RepID=UPI001F2B01D3|nr:MULTISPECIES: hypothetical protein [unclassified Chryseobacterium]UKB85037.1 hypothetical protein LF887_05270 [Chryseobacterium sp. MEBOG06]
MKRLMLYVLFPVFLFSQTTGKVIKISDGDTITLLLEGNQQKRSGRPKSIVRKTSRGLVKYYVL